MNCWSQSWTLLWGPAGSLLSRTQHWQLADRQSQWLFPHHSPCTLGLQGSCTLPGSGPFAVPAPCISFSCYVWAAAQNAIWSALVPVCTSSCCLPAFPSPFVFCPSLGQSCHVGLCPRKLPLLLPGRSTDPTHYYIPGCYRQPQGHHILPTASPNPTVVEWSWEEEMQTPHCLETGPVLETAASLPHCCVHVQQCHHCLPPKVPFPMLGHLLCTQAGAALQEAGMG